MPTMPGPRMITPSDYAALLELNNKYATELSWQEPDAFVALLESAYYVRTIGDGEALLLAFDQDSTYDNPNFRWFKANYDKFVYIDRIVCATSGRGDAGALYAALKEKAKEDGHTRLVCEINVEPPNPKSTAFHKKLGFKEVGEPLKMENGKIVAYFECPL